MSSTLNYDLKSAPPALFDGARWPVLTMLIVHSNKRNRCWPTMETIAEKTGKALPTVTAAKKWLIAHGAVELVPYDKRVDDEKKLAPRRHVYQLTGKIKIDDKPLAYLYDNDTDNGDIQNDTPLNVSENEISASKISVAKISIDKTQSISRKSRSKSNKISKSNTPEPSPNGSVQGAPQAPAPEGKYVPPTGFEQIYVTRQVDQESRTNIEHLIAADLKTPSPVCKRCKKPISDGTVSQSPGLGIIYQRCLGKDPLSKKVPEVPKPQSALTKAMHEATPEDVRPPKCNYGKNDSAALACLEAGFTPERVTAFVVATYPTYREWAVRKEIPAVMSMQHVHDYLKAWEAKQGKIVPVAEPVQVADDDSADDYIAWLQSQSQNAIAVKNSAWQGTIEQLEIQLGKPTFNNRVKGLRLMEVQGDDPKLFIVEACNEFQQQYVLKHLMHSLLKTLEDRARCKVRVEVRIGAKASST